MLTKDALARLWPRPAPALIDGMVAAADAALPRFGISTPLRLAMLPAMATVESMAGTRLAENLDYSAARLRQVWPKRFNAVSARLVAGRPEALAEKVYGGRLGNRPGTGDAFAFRGGGLPQFTGRDTYAAIGALLGLDLVTSPDLARDPAHALDVLCAFFFAWKDLGDAAVLISATVAGAQLWFRHVDQRAALRKSYDLRIEAQGEMLKTHGTRLERLETRMDNVATRTDLAALDKSITAIKGTVDVVEPRHEGQRAAVHDGVWRATWAPAAANASAAAPPTPPDAPASSTRLAFSSALIPTSSAAPCGGPPSRVRVDVAIWPRSAQSGGSSSTDAA